jgi:hypothetical protein
MTAWFEMPISFMQPKIFSMLGPMEKLCHLSKDAVKGIIWPEAEWDLRLMSVAATKDLLDVGRNLIIVALVGADLHIRIFDASGKKVVDKAESELISGEILTAFKKRLNPFLDESSLSKEDKQEIIRNATSIAGHTPEAEPARPCR